MSLLKPIKKQIPTKLQTTHLPPFNYLSLKNILIPEAASDFDDATKYIKSEKTVGFDTESKPIFEKGALNEGPHIVQFACKGRAYIFQLGNPECYNPLLYLLANDDIKKVGFDLASDRKLLFKKFNVSPRGFIDLCPIFKKKGFRNTVGVRGAIAVVLNQQFEKAKHVTMSNWSSPKLSGSQIEYAANDAYGALCVYLKLLSESSL